MSDNENLDRMRRSIIDAAMAAAGNLRATADRLESAAKAGDFARLAEAQISMSTWTIDQIRGAALALVRIGDNK